MEKEDKKIRLLESIQKDTEVTAANYAQMHERLYKRDICSKFFVTYYSIFAILFSLMPFFFREEILYGQRFDFLTISMSIVVLVASLLVSFAKYSERALKAVEALDDLKRLKKELAKYTEDQLRENDCKKYDEFVNRYHQIVDSMELRTDIDYYRTCKKLSTKDGYQSRWQNLSCGNKFLAHTAHLIGFGGYILLFLFPFVALYWCF